MKTMKSFLIGTIAIPFILFQAPAFGQSSFANLVIEGPTLPPAVRTAEQAKSYEQYNQFLQETGFPNLSADIERTLSGPTAKDLEQLNRETLELNWHRMQILNFARDFASELLSQLAPTMGDPESAAKTAELAARFLSQKRLMIPDAFPDAVRNIRNFDQRVAAKEQYLHGEIEKNIIRMQEQIVSDSLHTIYGREKIEAILNGKDVAAKNKMKAYIQRLDVMAYRYVRSLYYDHEMGLAQWLGEALALGLVHTSRLSKDPNVKKFEALLNNRAHAHGTYLSDAVSDTLTFEDESGKPRQMKIRQADTITELYGVAQTSQLSASAVRPHILNRLKATRHKLIQNLFVGLISADEGAEKWAANDGKKLTLLGKLRQYFANSPASRNGASHAGMAIVYKNSESGVAVTRAVDMYAFPWKSTRFVTAKSIFATPGIFANFGVATLNPAKTLAYLQKLIREKGYNPVFKVSDVYRPDKDGKLVKSEGETFSWTTNITEEEQRKILDVRMEDAEKWYTEDLAPRLQKRMVGYITDDGMAFREYGMDPSNKMSCYCSEGVNIAGYRETGFNLQSRPDALPLIARMARFVYPKLESKVYREVPVGPNFMGWDPKTETEVVKYVPRSAVQSWAEQMQAQRIDFDPQLTAKISQFITRNVNYNDTQIGQARYSPISLLENVEAVVVKNPSRPGETYYQSRANPMGVSNGESPKLVYNPVPETNSNAALVSEEDSKLRRNVHSTLIKAVKYVPESQAAGFILAEIYPRMNDEKVVSLFEAFTAKMMALKPINPPRLIPPEIKALPQGQREAAFEKYIREYTAQLIEKHTRQILSDISGILYGKEAVERAVKASTLPQDRLLKAKLQELYVLIGNELKGIYLDQELSLKRVFGTNLAIGLTNILVKSKDPKQITRLNESLKPYSLSLADFFEADLSSAKVQSALRLGEVSVLRVQTNPGQILRRRMYRPVKGIAPGLTERVQLDYSPYAEVQPELTRSLDVLFNAKPKFSTMQLTANESTALFKSSVYGYMAPANYEQMGKNGEIFTSEFLQANPKAPARPQYQPVIRTCKQLLAI